MFDLMSVENKIARLWILLETERRRTLIEGFQLYDIDTSDFLKITEVLLSMLPESRQVILLKSVESKHLLPDMENLSEEQIGDTLEYSANIFKLIAEHLDDVPELTKEINAKLIGVNFKECMEEAYRCRWSEVCDVFWAIKHPKTKLPQYPRPLWAMKC